MDWKSPKLNWVSQKLLGSFFFFFFCFLFLSHLSLEKLLVFPIFPFWRKGGGERPNLIITNQWNSFKLKSHSSQFESKRKTKRKKKNQFHKFISLLILLQKNKKSNTIVLFYKFLGFIKNNHNVHNIYIYINNNHGGWGEEELRYYSDVYVRISRLTNQSVNLY